MAIILILTDGKYNNLWLDAKSQQMPSSTDKYSQGAW